MGCSHSKRVQRPQRKNPGNVSKYRQNDKVQTAPEIPANAQPMKMQKQIDLYQNFNYAQKKKSSKTQTWTPMTQPVISNIHQSSQSHLSYNRGSRQFNPQGSGFKHQFYPPGIAKY